MATAAGFTAYSSDRDGERSPSCVPHPKAAIIPTMLRGSRIARTTRFAWALSLALACDSGEEPAPDDTGEEICPVEMWLACDAAAAEELTGCLELCAVEFPDDPGQDQCSAGLCESFCILESYEARISCEQATPCVADEQAPIAGFEPTSQIMCRQQCEFNQVSCLNPLEGSPECIDQSADALCGNALPECNDNCEA